MSNTISAESGTEESPSTQVVDQVAAAKGVSPVDVHPPLYDAIDPEALDVLVDGRESCRVTFEYAGCDVTVTASGDVFVSEK